MHAAQRRPRLVQVDGEAERARPEVIVLGEEADLGGVVEARRRYTRKLAYSQLSLILIGSAFAALAVSALVYEI